MDTFDWANFASITKEHEHHPVLEKAEALVASNEQERYALDLGCGGGRGTRFLLSRGWYVTAVDNEPASIAIVSAIDSHHLQVVKSAFEAFDFGEDRYDLVSAQFSLPFVHRDQFVSVFDRLKRSIKPGGVFAGQFFGPNDEWNKPGSDVTFVPRDAIPGLLEGMKPVELVEEDKEGGTATGAIKHWHVFHIIAQKDNKI
ncbi:MAG TPA: class I SAM-dependent methyltransferase [Chloroflexia bacterium]|nr:class I SAM-dependent methyltransferase [Chloroflexia bacterium]